jgi:hypothetical protein
MSSGAFVNSFYSSESTGATHPIRIQPETAALVLGGATNAAPSGAGAVAPSAQVSQSSRSLGINARTVTVRLTAALTGYQSGARIKLPWLDSTTFAAIVPKVTTGTYLGTAVIVVGKKAEQVN